MVVPLSFEVLGQSGCAYAVHIADGKPVPVAWIFRIGQRPFGERKMKMGLPLPAQVEPPAC